MLPGPASRNALEHRSAKAVQRYTFLCDLDLPGSPSVFAFRLLSELLTLQPLRLNTGFIPTRQLLRDSCVWDWQFFPAQADELSNPNISASA